MYFYTLLTLLKYIKHN